MPTQEEFLKQLQDQYSGYGLGSAADKASQMSTLGGASTFISSLANQNIGGFGDNQKRQALQDADIARQYGLGVKNPVLSQAMQDENARLNPTQYDPSQMAALRRQMDLAGGMDNFFGNTANSTQEQLNFQHQLYGAAENPFAGQNLNDESVKAQVREYQKRNPNYIPVNTYKGAAPVLDGEINQDTGMIFRESASGQNPYAGNNGFLQTDLMGGGQPKINPIAQAPQQNKYLQPFQQTSSYQSAMGNTYSNPNAYMGMNQQTQFQQPNQFQQPQQQQNYQQGLLGQSSTAQPQQNRYGLLSAYGTR
jgi:hypothetical protein